MITVEVGRALLDRYNQEQSTTLSGEDFFDKLVWPLFYDHPDKIMYWVCNSPFTQLESIRKLQYSAEARAETLASLKEGLANGRLIASTAVGFGADFTTTRKGAVSKWATTSSQQMAERYVPATAEEGYLSWIGGPAGIGVEGGFSLFLMDGYLLQLIQEGWSVYRNLLTKYPNLVGRQIESWNGQWLIHRLSAQYQPNNPTLGFMPLDELHTSVERISWAQLACVLAHHEQYQLHDQLLCFVCRYSQTNDTIGYVPMELGQIRQFYASMVRAYPVYGLTAQSDSYRHYGLKSSMKVGDACMTGSLGLIALKPKELDRFLGSIDTLPSFPGLAKSAISFSWACSHVWLQVALNDDSSVTLAKNLARTVHNQVGLSNWSDRLINELMGIRPRLPHGLKAWLARLTAQLQSPTNDEDRVVWDAFTHNQLNWSALFRWYFLTLLRFEFALLQS